METQDLLPTRLNFDPTVFSGCTMKEMQIIVLINLCATIIFFGSVCKLIFNMFLLGVGLSFPIAVALSWSTALFFQRVKQGKPKGYVKQKFLLLFADMGFIESPYIRRTGKWSVGRYL